MKSSTGNTKSYLGITRRNHAGHKKLVEKLLLQHRERPGNSQTPEAAFEATYHTESAKMRRRTVD